MTFHLYVPEIEGEDEGNGDDELNPTTDRIDRWSSMLPEILEQISDRLPLVDYLSFRGACRRWRSSPSGRSEIARFPKDRPWLMFYNFNGDGGCGAHFYSHARPRPCAIKLPQLEGCRILKSSLGWLLARRGSRVFAFNPFDFVEIQLPDHHHHRQPSDQACTFSCSPTSPDCRFFIASRRSESIVEISECRAGDGRWETRSIVMSKDRTGDLLAMRCEGEEEVRWIRIMGARRDVAFDCAENWAAEIDDDEKDRGGGGVEDEDWLAEMEATHGDDWAARFGEKDVCFSPCMIGTRVIVDAGCDGGDDDGNKGDVNRVRAVWIEPRF